MTLSYVNDQTNRIALFSCFSDTSSPVVQVSWENEVIYKEVQVNGISANLYLDSEEDEANRDRMGGREEWSRVPNFGVLGEEELICMAESVRAVPQNVICRPSWLPEGYYETSAEDCPVKGDKIPNGLDAGKSVLSYEDGKDGCLTITYAQEFNITGLRPDKCEADAVSVQVGENQAFLFLDQTEVHHLVWVDGYSGIFFWISGPFTEEELVRVAEGMEKLEELPPLAERQLTWVSDGFGS